MEARSLPGTQGDFRSLGTLRIAGNSTSRERPVFAEKQIGLSRNEVTIPRYPEPELAVDKAGDENLQF